MPNVCRAIFWCGLALAACFAAQPESASVPGQKRLLLVEGAFQYRQGSWAEYAVKDLAKNENYRMWISVLNQTTKKKGGKRTPYRWMEIEVEAEGQPPVVTRILAEETREGPGELEAVIVQVKGKSAFSVPRSFFESRNNGTEPKVTQFEAAQQVERLERRRVSHGNREFEAWSVEAVDGAGKRLKAVVSEELAPIGVYLAESGEVRMQLVDWGEGAKTKIRGRAYPFWLWVAGEVAKESSR